MIRLSIFIQVSEENRPATLEMVKEPVEKSLRDNSCIAYDILEGATRSNVLMICETWEDIESLLGHKRTEHFVALAPKLQGLDAMKFEEFTLQGFCVGSYCRPEHAKKSQL